MKASIFILLLALPAVALRAHDHLNAGAASQAQGAPLLFVNGSNYAVSTHYAMPLELLDSGPRRGWFGNAAFTFTALWATPMFGPVPPNPPAVGSFIKARVISLSGPEGGVFSFTEGNGTSAGFTVPVGTTNGTHSFELSENYDMEPDSDPFGHLHDRVWAVNKPGVYTLGIRLFDASPNGVGGGPIHAESGVYQLTLQAWQRDPSVTVDGTNVVTRFYARRGFTVSVEAGTTLDGTPPWQTIWGPAAGDDRFHFVTNGLTDRPRRFFRMREEEP
jgi:hypothetical protein